LSSSSRCHELTMLQSGSMESQRYISLMLNAEIDCKPSYEQLFLSRIQYDIAHSDPAGLYDIGVLEPRAPRAPTERPTIATHTADSALTEERGKLFCHLTERIRSVAQNFTSEQRDCIFGHSIDPYQTTKAVAYALQGKTLRLSEPQTEHKIVILERLILTAPSFLIRSLTVALTSIL
jgi:hypothetical protein